MLVPINWLKDYVDINVSPKELADKLTMSGSKVEELNITGDEIQNVVTGKLIKIERHPNADRLSICQVDIGKEEPIQIVTAATNMKENDVVPTALHGAVLYDGTKIKKGKLRGVVSNGMFCSEVELGLADEKEVDGLMILPSDTPVGKDIKEIVKMTSAVIDFEITCNRRDCFSIYGIARETAATLNTELKKLDLTYSSKCHENINDNLKVSINDDLCKRYMARGIKNVKIESSPQWMQERLLEAEIKPVNNIVDITNFVMLELGQPMHAFDRNNIHGENIIVERAKDKEKFTTLDGVERELDNSMLCIKDDEKTIALAGVMGGENSEIKEDTKEIIFECANFDGVNIRNTSKKLVLRTDASGKFEKNLDPNAVEIAMNRACNLIEKLGAGEIMEGTIDVYEDKIEPHTVTVDYNWINKFLGLDISKDEMKSYLDRLELNTEIKDDYLIVNVPTFRSDINIKEDVAEEIVRIYGYDKVPSSISNSQTIRSGKSLKQKFRDKVVETLISSGMNQSVNYPFVSPKIFEKLLIPEDSSLRNAIKIKNPLGEDYSIMRTTTISSMMECMSRNYLRNNHIVRLFEIGKIYLDNQNKEELPYEHNILTLGMYGKCDYLDIKGVVENVIDALGIYDKCSFKRETENPSFHPGKTSALCIGKEKIGVIGEIHPDVCENYEIDVNTYIAEINLDKIYECATLERQYKKLPKFPAVTRDLAILINKDILVQDIEEIIKKQGGNLLESYRLFDVYEGKQIPNDKKSVAYSLIYRLSDRTLTDKEVNKVHDKIVRSLEYKLGAELR